MMLLQSAAATSHRGGTRLDSWHSQSRRTMPRPLVSQQTAIVIGRHACVEKQMLTVEQIPNVCSFIYAAIYVYVYVTVCVCSGICNVYVNVCVYVNVHVYVYVYVYVYVCVQSKTQVAERGCSMHMYV